METSDPRVIRALAHPVRLDLLELLVTVGPATAAQCGRLLGLPQANCSFHLRQLAKYGFVEEAGPSDDRRERQWRMPHARIRFRDADGRDRAQTQLQELILQRSMQAILDFTAQADTETQQWRDAATLLAGVAIMTADEATELKERWKDLVAPYIARAVGGEITLQPDQRHVRYIMAETPMPTRPRGQHDDQHDDQQQGKDSQ
jgi:DNA-binding transcriptional ArsR family regulator